MKNDKDVQIMQVIRTTILLRGTGQETDPIRRIEQFWDMEGNLLFEIDPIKKYN